MINSDVKRVAKLIISHRRPWVGTPFIHKPVFQKPFQATSYQQKSYQQEIVPIYFWVTVFVDILLPSPVQSKQRRMEATDDVARTGRLGHT
jgi:hypothetical protein